MEAKIIVPIKQGGKWFSPHLRKEICPIVTDDNLEYNLLMAMCTHMSLCKEKVQFGPVTDLTSKSVGVLTGSQTSTKMSSVILSALPELAGSLPASELSCLLYCMLWTCA